MPLLGRVWIIAEDGETYWPQINPILRELPPTTRLLLMDRDDQAAYRKLPGELVIYRGGGPVDLMGPAWSTQRRVAEILALREAPLQPMVAQASVRRCEVYAYFTARDESEVLLSPADTPSLRVLKTRRLRARERLRGRAQRAASSRTSTAASLRNAWLGATKHLLYSSR